MTVPPGASLGSSIREPREPLPSATGLSTNETPAPSERKGEDPAVVNAKIEAQLKRDTETFKREESRVLKVLLLGQAGSGKSTTLKNFRMRYARDEWEQERLGWRAIIQLNIVRQVLAIIQIIESEYDKPGFTGAPRDERAVVDVMHTWISDSGQTGSSPASRSQPDANIGVQRSRFTEKHQHLVIWLGPRLSKVEQELKSRLAPHEIHYSAIATPLISATPFEPGEKMDDDLLIRKKVIEYSVRSWRDVLDAAPKPPSPSSGSTATATKRTDPKSSPPMVDYVDTPTQTIADLKEGIKALWVDKDVRAAVRQQRSEVPDSVGIDSDGESPFLDEIDRIARTDYEVSDYDIVRARLKTVGIQEYKLTLDTGAPIISGGKKWSWRIYDVGGCRTMRKAWLPYFDNVQVIIFLAPVSVFDERLEEDPRVNRLEDSVILWSCICETPLLANTQLILFLNKCDLLQRKLSKGVKVVDYLSSYGKRSNDPKSVIKYMREKFKTIHREKSPTERTLCIYPTTVTDTASTAITLEAVRDNVVRRHLATSQFM